MKNKIAFIILLAVALSSCSSNNQIEEYHKTALDDIITTYITEPNYSVILSDMKFDEDVDIYSHKYMVMIEKPQIEVDSATLHDTTAIAQDVEIVEMDWVTVDAIHFEKHIEDLGMVLLSKKNGVLDKNSSPAGLDNYVGNERYGNWNTHSNGSSFWAFYGQYYFMSRMFYRPYYHYPRSVYSNYHSNYRGQRSFYGSGTNQYGSKSTSNRSSSWGKRSSAFKSSVRSKVSKSATNLKSRRYSSRSRYSRTSRSGSRYSGTSSRSRGGGFGK